GSAVISITHAVLATGESTRNKERLDFSIRLCRTSQSLKVLRWCFRIIKPKPEIHIYVADRSGSPIVPFEIKNYIIFVDCQRINILRSGGKLYWARNDGFKRQYYRYKRILFTFGIET